MAVAADLRYSESHEWVRVVGDLATVGITDHAQAELGDIVYVELPEAGRVLAKDATFGAVESVKAVSDLYSPLTGLVEETNTELGDQTELVNQDPYGRGWMIRVRMQNLAELDSLMDASAYAALVDEPVK